MRVAPIVSTHAGLPRSTNPAPCISIGVPPASGPADGVTADTATAALSKYLSVTTVCAESHCPLNATFSGISMMPVKSGPGIIGGAFSHRKMLQPESTSSPLIQPSTMLVQPSRVAASTSTNSRNVLRGAAHVLLLAVLPVGLCLFGTLLEFLQLEKRLRQVLWLGRAGHTAVGSLSVGLGDQPPSRGAAKGVTLANETS